MRAVPEPGMEAMLAARGRMGALVGARDWGSSPLAGGGWPQSLRTSLSICLSTRFPAFLFWGPDLVQLYNDSSCRCSALSTRPRSAGRP